ncbi:Hypothetical protein GLP15_2179 [Giardia lamblia P15]|uniref:Deoxynucleoside kinase domain-containing protein n=1 Tax=Giardia intestinalis (strain P15) TaxID=658858 RepID=E1F6X0_GIAIA|nr:Hypothetical protein GLP15_2179 [Giardia lamblia P15]
MHGDVFFFVFFKPDPIPTKEFVSPDHELINLNAVVALRNINLEHAIKKGPKISGEDNTTAHVFIYNVYTSGRKAVRNKMYGSQPKLDMPNHPVTVPGLIVIDGPIGAGKTTFIEHLRDELVQSGARVRVIDEAIPPKLEEYYKDPARNVYAFQKAFVLRLFDTWAGRPSASTTMSSAIATGLQRARLFSTTMIRAISTISSIGSSPILLISLSRCAHCSPSTTSSSTRPTRRASRAPGRDEYIRRYNNFPFFGEGDASSLLEVVDKKAATFACSRAVLGRFAQQTKVIHLTGIKENTTRGTMLPEKNSVDVAAELVRTGALTRHTREFLMEEVVLVATTRKPSSVTTNLSSK